MILEDLAAATRFLRQHGAIRNAEAGGWYYHDLHLCPGPIESAKALRRELMRADIEANRAAGRYCTR